MVVGLQVVRGGGGRVGGHLVDGALSDAGVRGAAVPEGRLVEGRPVRALELHAVVPDDGRVALALAELHEALRRDERVDGVLELVGREERGHNRLALPRHHLA